MRRIGILIKTNDNKALFVLDEPLDVEELERIKADDHIRAEIRFDDNRTISAEQRKKAWALMGDISRYTGYSLLEVSEQMKIKYAIENDVEWISLSDCSVTEARTFISFLIEFCFEWNIPFKNKGLEMHDDIKKYLWLCLKYKKCAICGKKADVHHVEAVGMGSNRNRFEHWSRLLMALCRNHHTESHKIGQKQFMKKYMVQGIKLSKDDVKRFKIGG